MREHFAALAALLTLAGCTQAPPAGQPRRPEQAGQPVDPVHAAARIATIRAAAMTGNEGAMRQQMEGMQEDFRKSIKLPDPSRRIDPESARAAARNVPGVRSANWIDHENLLVMVTRNDLRSESTIDAVCMQLEPLGDTLAVVVNLQSAVATNSNDLQVLSRNCQLALGDRAFLQRNRQVDVVAPHVRAQHRLSQASMQAAETRKAKDDRDNAGALEGIPEM